MLCTRCTILAPHNEPTQRSMRSRPGGARSGRGGRKWQEARVRAEPAIPGPRPKSPPRHAAAQGRAPGRIKTPEDRLAKPAERPKARRPRYAEEAALYKVRPKRPNRRSCGRWTRRDSRARAMPAKVHGRVRHVWNLRIVHICTHNRKQTSNECAPWVGKIQEAPGQKGHVVSRLAIPARCVRMGRIQNSRKHQNIASM